jgi:two-component system response regulator RegA
MTEVSPAEDRPSLLLVDDDALLRETMGRALVALGFEVRTAPTHDAARALAKESPPEYAVVDLKLADGSGLKLVSELLALDPHTRIVVVTAYGSIATAIEAIKLGATYYLAKPVDAQEVVRAFEHREGNTDVPLNDHPMSVDRLEWEYIDRVLHDHKGNVSATARALSMHRRTLQRKLAKRPVRR